VRFGSVKSECVAAVCRDYETPDSSRNHWMLGLIAHGNGFHNNHHARPKAAMHGHRWWEWDLSYWTICLFEKVGLARKIIRVEQA
jgi:stearoyl-CoA desaturase (delta-9 desaturase)